MQCKFKLICQLYSDCILKKKWKRAMKATKKIYKRASLATKGTSIMSPFRKKFSKKKNNGKKEKKMEKRQEKKQKKTKHIYIREQFTKEPNSHKYNLFQIDINSH